MVPGGLATSLFIGLFTIGTTTNKYCDGFADGVQHCTDAAGHSSGSNILGIALSAFPVLAPIATSAYPTRRAA